jgi:hypothetical protein
VAASLSAAFPQHRRHRRRPEPGAWNSTHNGQSYQGTYDAFEQQVTTAEQIAWVHTFSDGIVRDSGDVLIELMEFAIQWRKANNLPTSAK